MDVPSKTHRITLKDGILWENLRKKLILDYKVPDASIDSALDEGGLFIDHRRVTRENLPKKIHKGDLIEISYFLEEVSPIVILDDMILYHDDDYLVVNKPSGIPVQPTRVSVKQCLDYALREKLQNQNLMSVHRLDRQTSGLVLYAMNERSAKHLMIQFQEKKIEKKYWAVVYQPIEKESWDIKGYIYQDRKDKARIYYRLAAKTGRIGKWSETQFRVLKREGAYALIEANPVTGRTHQIRVHLKASGHPVVGDYLYGQSIPGIRLQLHSQSISFFHHQKKEMMSFSVLPDDFLI